MFHLERIKKKRKFLVVYINIAYINSLCFMCNYHSPLFPCQPFKPTKRCRGTTLAPSCPRSPTAGRAPPTPTSSTAPWWPTSATLDISWPALRSSCASGISHGVAMYQDVKKVKGSSLVFWNKDNCEGKLCFNWNAWWKLGHCDRGVFVAVYSSNRQLSSLKAGKENSYI